MPANPPSDAKPVVPEAVAEYRMAVTDLVARSVQGVRAFPLADDAEPLERWDASR
jgi:hypothetical protein